MKVIRNTCYGGFGLSDEAIDLFNQRSGEPVIDYISSFDDKIRSNPILVQIVEELGEEADGFCARLEVVEIPDGTNYYISDYDGVETICEGRTW